MSEFILTGANILTMDENCPFIEGGSIHIKDNKIIKIGQSKNINEEGHVVVINLNGKLVMPGLINIHTHLYSSLARGMPVSATPKNFCQILEGIWWKLDKVLNYEEIYYSALVGLIDSVKSGVTTVIDHHASPNAISGSLEEIAQSSNEIGIRACLCYEVSDRDGLKKAELGIKENVDFAKKTQKERNLLLASLFGLHASFTLSNTTLRKCREASRELNVPCHIHVAEDKFDLEDSLKKHKKSVVMRLADTGILKKDSLAAHCIHITPEEIKKLKELDVFVAHNPESNMNNAVGYSKVPQMLKAGITVGLGTDGYTANILQEIKTLSLLHKFTTKDPCAMGFDKISDIAFKNNAKIASAYFKQPLGKIKEGSKADIVILNYHPPTPLTGNNFMGHVIFGLNPSHVESVIVNGNFVMKEKNILGIDEEKVLHESRKISKKLWEKL